VLSYVARKRSAPSILHEAQGGSSINRRAVSRKLPDLPSGAPRSERVLSQCGMAPTPTMRDLGPRDVEWGALILRGIKRGKRVQA